MDGIETQLERLEVRLLGRVERLIGRERKWLIGLWVSTVLAVIAARLI